jgi:hypothetical protein
VFVSAYTFTLTEHDTDRPWIVVSQEERTVALDDGANFFKWAAEHWPGPRWTVELAPWQLGPKWPGSARPSGSSGR